MTTKARNSSGEDYICKYDWQKTFVQSGAHGVVLGKSGGYSTAFFEAFPNDPKCFVRGEGTTIEEAEESPFVKKVIYPFLAETRDEALEYIKKQAEDGTNKNST